MPEQNVHIIRVVRYLIRRFRREEVTPSAEDRDALWQKICREVDRQTELRKRRLRLRIMSLGVAASLLIAVSVGLFTRYMADEVPDIEEVAVGLLSATQSEEPEQPLLVMSPERIIPLQNHTKVEYSADGQVSLKSKNEVSHLEKVETEKGKDEPQVAYNTIIVPKGKHTRLQLADGSELHINSGSRVVYPSEFTGDKREIFVDGEIYIDVKPDKAHPFRVKTSAFEVSVLGTAFDVCAYSQDSKAEVILVRGRVRIDDKSGGTMELAPDQLARIENKQIVAKETVDAESCVSWTQGLLKLDGEPLRRLLFKLEQYYGTVVTCDDAVKDLDIHGCLDINCTLAEVLERIAITASLRIEAAGEGFHIHAANNNNQR